MGKERQTLEHVLSPFNDITVERVDRRIDLEVAGATFATWHATHLLTGYSWDAITAGCFLAKAGPPKRILILGLGGGTVTRQLRHLLPEAKITGVEIDGEVLRVARQYMALDRQGLEVIEADAYDYLKNTRRRFDVIVDDVYLTGSTDVWRPDDLTEGALDLLAARRRPGGIVLANFITDGDHDRQRKAAQKAFARHFTATALVRPPRGFNGIIVGGDRLVPPKEALKLAGQFEASHDRALWQKISIRRYRAG